MIAIIVGTAIGTLIAIGLVEYLRRRPARIAKPGQEPGWVERTRKAFEKGKP